jgi:hypothetical protein
MASAGNGDTITVQNNFTMAAQANLGLAGSCRPPFRGSNGPKADAISSIQS